jgi:hypothetical protein
VEEIILHAMSRSPADRYPDARVMQAELAHPENVKVTSRADRLLAPNPMQARWTGAKIYIIAAVVPIALFLFFFLRAHLRWK